MSIKFKLGQRYLWTLGKSKVIQEIISEAQYKNSMTVAVINKAHKDDYVGYQCGISTYFQLELLPNQDHPRF